MHILITVNAAWNIWNFRHGLVLALMADGHRITVLAPHDESVPDLEGVGARFIHLEMNVKGLNPIDDLRLFKRLRDVFRAERPDVVLSYTIKNNVFGALAARTCGVPFIPNVTGLGTAFLSSGVLQAVAKNLYRLAFRNLPVVFFQNTDDKELFTSLGIVQPQQAQVLPGSGIDLEHFATIEMPSAKSVVFLFIGRLLRDKGVVELVDAARIVKTVYPEVKIQLLGPTDWENRTAISAEIVQKWAAEGVVEYLGTTKDVRPFIAQAHCIVLPSYREGAPRTLIEAASMGRPLIASDVPGCRSVVERERTGFLCEARNAKSLADAMLRFLALDDAQQAAMGRAGRAKIESEYDEATVVENYRRAIRYVSERS